MIKSKTSEDIFDGFFDDEICTARTAHLLGRKKQIVGKMRVHKKRFVKVMALLVALAIGAVGVAIGLMFMPKGGVSVNDGYASVAYEVKDGETFAPDKGYTGLDVFGRLNWTFAHKTDWYGDMHGAVHTTVEQDIRTYKQFHDGVLISADITKSSLVNSARQFCYVPAEDRVIWREAACSPSEYKGFDTAWKTGAPTGNMTISGADGFRAKNGLPATELSVYIFREETILSAEPVKTNTDGTYTITYTLDPNLYNEEDGSCTGAVAYYANQMMFSGGLTAKPEFTSVKVSYTFNDKWETLRCDTEEEYSATMGFTVGCKAEATTYYSYDVSNPPFEETDAFDSYFSEYVSKPATGVEEAPLDSMGAITSAFGKVISEPTTLYLDLNIDDEPVNGLVYVDLHNGGSIADIAMDKIEIRAALGNLGVYLDGGAAFVAVGDWKLKLTISELMGMMGELMGADGGSSIDTQALLEELLGAPLTVDGGKANMHSEIALAGINIPLDFNYFIDEDENVTLDNVKTELNINDITLAAQLGYSDQPAPAALENKEQFIELSSYIGSVMDIALAEAIHADISYDNADLGISLTGGADVKIKDGIAAKAQVAVDFDGVTKNIGIAFDGSAVYIDVDGLKLSADVDNTMALVGEFVDLPEISLGGFDIAELIHTVLFTPVLTDNISITQESAEDISKLAIALKGTELLKAFGLDFKLGDVKLAVSDGKIEGSAYGANIAVTPAKSFTVETDGYTEISDYAAEIAEIIEGGNLAVAVSYAGNDIEATGDLKINIKDLIVSGNVGLRYKGVEKTIGIIYKDKVAYISLDGLKVSASVDEVVSLVKSLMPHEEDDGQNTEKSAAAGDDGGLDLEEIIKQVLGLNLGDYITIGDSDDKLNLAIKGTELLKAFGLDFKLGDVKLAVSDGKIEGSAYGANIAITPAQAFTVETDGYTEISDYAAEIAEIIEGGNLAVAVNYAGNDIEATGDLKINIKDLIVSGNVGLKYKGVEKTIGIIYKDKVAYISLDGLKVSASVDEVVSLVKSLMPKQEDGGQNTEKSAAADDNGGLDLEAIIKQVLGLNLGDYITIGDSDNKLNLAIKGTELLKAFGLDFKLGDVKLAVSDGKIEGSAYGANIAVTPAQAFTVETIGYAPMDGILAKIPALLSAQAIELEGRVVIGVKDKEIVLTLNGGNISWSEGFEAILDITIGEYGNIKARITSSDVQLAYGNIGVKLAFGDFDGLADTLFKAYSQLRDIVTRVLENNEENNPLPELNGISDLMGLLGDGSETSGALSKLLSGLISGDKDDGETDGADKLDIVSLINDMTIESGENGGFVRIGLYGLELELCDDTSNGGFARASLAAELDGVTVSAELGADIYADQLPAMPDIQYLDVEQLDGLLGYVTAAVNTLEKRNIGFNLSGTIGSDEEKYAEVGGIKYNFNASIDYCLADGQLLLIKLLNKSVVIDSSAYIKASVALEATLPEEDSLYLDITVYDRERTQESVGDGVLDFVVSISKFKQDDEKYDPLVFTAPADEIMTLLSGALKLFGIDNQTIDDFLVSKWLTPDVAAKFTALGSELMDRIKDMIGFDLSKIADLVNGKTDGTTDTATAQSTDNGTETAHEYGKAVKALNYDKQTGNFNVIVDLGAILGGGLGDIELNLGRETGENPCLTALSLVNFKVNGTTVDFEAALTYDEVVAANPLEGWTKVGEAVSTEQNGQKAKYYYDFDGADNLLISLVNSIVGDASENQEVMSGEPNPNYVVNRNFYIDGSVNADLFGFKVTIDLIAISVSIDQNGDIGINIRLGYNGFIEVINGNTTLDITIKDNMVFMKRVQTTETGITNKKISPITLYRAMPLDNFMNDILGQLGFILNFSDKINSQLEGADTALPSGDTTKEVKDYGTIVAEVLKSYTCLTDDENKVGEEGEVTETNDVWDLKLDGRSFSNNILGDLEVKITTDANKLIRNLNIPQCQILIPLGTKIPILAPDGYLELDLSLNLTWHNPGGISDGTKDETDKTLAETVASATNGMGGMIEKLNKEGWGEKQYLEAEVGSVAYYNKKLDGSEESLNRQDNLMLSTGNDGNAKGTWYCDEAYFPETLETDEFYSVWDKTVSNGKLYAQPQIKSYQVTFLSQDEIGGWDFDESENMYKFVAQIKYGSQIKFIASNTEFEDALTVRGNMRVLLPERPLYDGDPSIESKWAAAIDENGAEFMVNYASVIAYHSDVEFDYNGNKRTSLGIKLEGESQQVITPTADGHTFLGWFFKTDDGWKQITTVNKSDEDIMNGTLEAAWIDHSKLTVETSKDSLSIVKNKYTVTANSDCASAIVGALPDNITLTHYYTFIGLFGSKQGTENNQIEGNYNKVQVDFKFSYGGMEFTVSVTKNF